MTDNEQGYKPTTEEVRDQYADRVDFAGGVAERVARRKAEFDRWLAATLAAHQVKLVADSREALARGLADVDGLHDIPDEQLAASGHLEMYGKRVDALLASGAVQVTTPTETDEAIAHEQWRYSVALGFALRTLNEEQGVAFLRAWEENLPASRPAPVAPPTEEWEDLEPQLITRGKYKGSRHSTCPDCRGDGVCEYRPRTREQYEADQPPVVPVDALGFPTQDGATFTAVEKGSAVKRRYSIFGGEVFKGRTVLPKSFIDPASIEDVRPADGRNGQ